MALNGPRISAGASGLGSKVSMWLGPPPNQMRTTASAAAGRVRPSCRAWARAASQSRRERPPVAPRTPPFRKFRRLQQTWASMAVSSRSGIEQELTASQQAPEQVLHPHATIGTVLPKVDSERDLGIAGQAAERPKIGRLDDGSLG